MYFVLNVFSINDVCNKAQVMSVLNCGNVISSTVNEFDHYITKGLSKVNLWEIDCVKEGHV